MRCRRCDSTRLIRLQKKCSRDNDVFRCQECGFLFSPSTPAEAIKQRVPSLKPQELPVGREPTAKSGFRPAVEEPEKAPVPAGSGNQPGHLPAEKGQSWMAGGKTSNPRTPPSPGKLSPEEFAQEILGVELWHKQAEVLSALPNNQRVAVKSGNGLGKGGCASVAVLWFLYSHDPAIVLSTPPTFRQVQHLLGRQIRQLHRREAA